MSQKVYIPVNDDEAVDTLYYELQYRRVGDTNYTQQLRNAPLPVYVIESPWSEVPYFEVSPPSADATAYEFQMRRFDQYSNASDWFTGTFTTP